MLKVWIVGGRPQCGQPCLLVLPNCDQVSLDTGLRYDVFPMCNERAVTKQQIENYVEDYCSCKFYQYINISCRTHTVKKNGKQISQGPTVKSCYAWSSWRRCSYPDISRQHQCPCFILFWRRPAHWGYSQQPKNSLEKGKGTSCFNFYDFVFVFCFVLRFVFLEV